MIGSIHARRPVQVNACFQDGAKRAGDILAALREIGVTDDQLTLMRHPGPEDEEAEHDFFERLRARFGHAHASEHDDWPRHYDLLVITHLGADATLAAPVEACLRRLGANHVSYYGPLTADPTRLAAAASRADREVEAARQAGFTGAAGLDPGEDAASARGGRARMRKSRATR
jgi:hypothetical protein